MASAKRYLGLRRKFGNPPLLPKRVGGKTIQSPIDCIYITF